jgi:phage terminase small subunit
MTQRQKSFCENLVSGMNQSTAYRLAYPSCISDGAARASASKLLTKPNVRHKVEELQKESSTEKTLSRQKKRELLAEIALNKGLRPMDRLAAIKVDNQMSGDTLLGADPLKGSLLEQIIDG